MNSRTRQHRRTRTIGATGVALAVLGGWAAVVDAGGSSRSHGVFRETAAGAAAPLGYDIHGSASMTVGPSGTVVRINVSGLDPGKPYGSHLHNDWCANGGGGHYQDKVGEGEATTPPNELWLTTSGTILEANPGGVAHATGSATWQARTSGPMSTARSVVVHEPGGVRIACADLN